MSLEDVIKRKLQEQKKDEQNEQDRLKQTAIQALRNQKAGKHVVQQTEPQKSGTKGMDFLQAGALKNINLGKEFQDGYQFGDIAKTELALKKAVAQTILGTGLDNTLNMWKGIGGTVEGVVDLGMYGVAGIQKATGHEKAAEKTKKAAQADFFGETVLGDALEFVNRSSVLGNTSKSIAAGIGQGALTVGLGMLTGGLGAAASTAITTGVTGLSSMGQGMTEAYEGNATDKEAALYGLISGVVDAGTELLTGGLGKGANAIGIGKGIGGIDDMIASGLTKNIKNKFAKNLAQMGVKAVGEGVEEALSYAGQTLAKKWTYLSEKELKELWSNQELLENFVVGTLTSAFMQAGDAADATAKGQDFVTGRTDAEQTVIDKVYKDRVAEQEKGGKKLTTKEKGQILDTVEQAYERGEIAVEDIEAALGGETYRKYTEATKQQEAMQAEFDQLNGMKKSDMTGAQEDRLQELRQQLETMKTEDAVGKLQVQYLQEAWAKVGSGKLAESYNQREQRRQAFQADVESYDAKQRAIVQKAIDSGILNNTRKSHEFVDLVAKIGAETGTDFDFTDSKKLRESGFALEGVTVNGFTDGKTVTVNINSAKALNTVVGHEIMHVLEGTELAGKLQEQLFAYAKTKGEFDKRRADLETLYAGRDADIDRELAADLVGDYLFTDIDFVRNLKSGDRNLFQRVFDEIKHLVKLATAGSKEARELEKVKKLFEDVYREAGTEKSTAKDGGVEYSVSQKNDTESQQFKRWFGDWQNNPENASKIVNQDGTPKVMYHGSPAQFSVFDKKKAKGSGMYGRGFYFTDSAEQASVYGNRYSVYLDVKHPLQSGGEQVSRQQVRKFLEAVAENEDYSIENYGTYDVEQVLQTVMGSQKNADAFKIIQDINATAIGDMVEAAELFNSINGTAFDGIVVPTETVVFRPEQIKSATDNVGTFDGSNPDIRYSLSPEADKAYMDAVENANIEAAQVMVDEAANEAGFTVSGHHGTYAMFNEFSPDFLGRHGLAFGPGFYFSTRRATAKSYEEKGGRIIDAYLKAEKSLSPDEKTMSFGQMRKFAKALEKASKKQKLGLWGTIELYTGEHNDLDIINELWYKARDNMRHEEFFGILRDTLGYDSVKVDFEGANETFYVVFNADQIKSADPVTYDDEGNVIPLSQRFNPKSKDIRESLSRAGETAGFDDSQIYGRDVALEGPEWTKPVAAQTESKAPGMEAPTAAEMPKAQTVEAPVAEEKTVQTEQEEAKAAPAMEAPTAAEMAGEKPVEAPVAEEAKEGAVKEAETEEPEKPKTYTLTELLQQEEENLQTQVQELEQKHREDMARLDQRIKDLRAAESRRGQKAEIRWNQLENRIASFENEIEENRNAMQEVAAEYDKIIAEKQNEIQKKKRKESGSVQSLKRSIAHQKKLKANAVAKYRAKIETLEVRLAEAKEDLASAMRDSDSGKTLSRINAVYGQKKAAEERFKKKIEHLREKITANRERMRNVTAGQDAYVRKEQQIQRRLEADKITLRETFDQRIAQIREKTASEEEFTAEKARELYEAVRDHKKGDHWPAEIKEMLDWGYSYQQIKSALLMVENKPGAKTDPNVPHEKTAREIIARAYDDAVYKILELETDYGVQERNLEDAAKAELEKFKKNYRGKESRMKYAIEAARLIGNIKGWKDKKTGWSYQINTLGRNLREVVRDEEGNPDTETADAITDYLEGNYDRNEAELNKEANRIKEAYRQMNMTKEENVYVQMLGEYRSEDNNGEKIYVTKDEVESFYEAHKDQIDTEKVETILEMARKMYDDLFERENEIRRQHGMEELKYIKGYFPHWQETQQKVWQKILNIKPGMEEKQPTRIAGTTGYHRPNVQSRFFQKERRGPLTEFNFMKGLDMYVDGALDQIYHIPDIQRRKAVENHLRLVAVKEGDPEGAEQLQKKLEAIQDSDVYNADEAQAEIDKLFEKQPNDLSNLVQDLRKGTDVLTGKKTIEDQAAEIAANKTIMQDMAQLSSRVSANQIVGSISTAASNVIPIVQNMAVVGPAQTGKAMLDAMRSIGKDDSVVEKSTFLTNRLRQNEKLYKEFWDKASDVLSKPMTVMDSIASETVWRSKYMQNLERGMTEAEAIQDADRYAKGLMASRSRGNMPTIFASKNPLLRGFTQYQLEQINQYMFAAKDIPLEVKNEGKVALPMAYAKLLIGSHLLNGLLQMITGREMVTDPIGILGEIGKDIFREIGDDDEEEPLEEAGKVTVNALKELAQELPFIGSALGGGRFPIASAMPYGGAWEMVTGAVEDVTQGDLTNLFKEFMSAIFYGAMPMGGGQLKKTLEGAGMWLEMDDAFPFVKPRKTTGSYTAKGDLRFKVEANPWNVFKSLIFGQYSSQAAREYFDEGRKPLSEGQLEEFQSVDMSMSEYWDYRDALKAAGDKTADKMEVVMGLDLPMEQKNILANNIVDRKDPIDLTGAEDFGSFAEFDFFNQHRKKYDFLKGSGVPIAQYLTMEAANNALKEYEPGSEEMQKFLKDNNLTLEKCQALQREKQTLDFRYNSGEKKYAFLINNGISVQEFEAMSQEEKDEVNMLYENPKKMEFLRGKGITAAQYKDLDKVTKEDLDYQYKNPEKYSFLQKNGISVADYSGFDKATKDAWDTMAKNPKKYEFLKKQGVTVDQYKLFNQGWKDAWNWAYDNQDAYLVSQGVTEDLYTYRRYVDKIKGISGDKNEKGNTISGSKRKKIWAYIQTLPLSDGAKRLLFKQMDPDDDTYDTEVVRYVQSLGMTYAEKKRILEKLGFKIDANGKITK